jgi:hypothetical protein
VGSERAGAAAGSAAARPTELEALIAEYEAGARVGELAKVYELYRTTVARHVARAGKTRPVMTEAQIDEAVRLYWTGGRCTRWVSSARWQSQDAFGGYLMPKVLSGGGGGADLYL